VVTFMQVLCPEEETGTRRAREREGKMVDLEELPQDLREVVAFHGHLCPGLLIGYRAAKAASAALQVGASEDEELVVIAENRSCSVDAFQSMLSTTLGKGNLLLRDYGKQVFTVADRASGRAVRVALRPPDIGARGMSREERIEHLLNAEAAELFYVNQVEMVLPDLAEVVPTVRCARCEEGVMSTRTVESSGRVYCIPCAVDLGLRSMRGCEAEEPVESS
jgi:formylmethanofuran dehydrogenase subunit E